VPAVAWAVFQQARPTDENVVAWCGNGRRRKIGIPTRPITHLVVVDTDTDEGEPYVSSNLPETPMQVVTKKGRQRYLPASEHARAEQGSDPAGH
jgi:hypothetical protein